MTYGRGKPLDDPPQIVKGRFSAIHHVTTLESFFEFAALEGNEIFVLGTNPAFLVTVNEAFVALTLDWIKASAGAGRISKQAAIQVFSVRLSKFAVLFAENDRKEFAVGLLDQIAEFSGIFHLVLALVCFDYRDKVTKNWRKRKRKD
jgi:hypothetical protein